MDYGRSDDGKQTLQGIADGTSNPVMVVEDAGRMGHWVKGKLVGTLSSTYPCCLNAGWADYNIKVRVDGTDPTGTANPGPCVINCTNNDEIYAFHSGGANGLRADGSVQFMRESMPAGVLAALISRAGGEVFTET